MEVVISIFTLIAGIGVFMIGMKWMSDGLERGSGSGMRKLFGKISNNRFIGVGVGAAATAIIQSSSATTVMVIGFVNAGLMTLFQAASIIMGANIGTTVTGLLVSLSSFDITLYFGALALVGVMITMFAKSDKLKLIGTVLSGFGLIFVGLDLASSAFKNATVNAALTDVFMRIDFPLLLILIGIVATGIMQSSSAITGIVITMAASGALPLECALFIVLGTNIGTCVTAAIAAIGASTNAKRAAVIHFLFNVIGTIVFTAIMWPLSGGFVWLFTTMFPNSPAFQVSMFHVFFNIATTALLLPFIKPLTKLATLIIKDKPNDESVLKLYYIDDRFLQTPPIAVAQVTKEVDHMAEMVRKNFARSMHAVLTGDLSEKEKVYRDEARINYVNKGVARYLVKLSALSLSKTDEKYVGSLYHVVSDFERIGDHAENFIEEAEDLVSSENGFSAAAKDELAGMYEKVMNMFDLSVEIFKTRDISKLPQASLTESEVDTMKKLLVYRHVERLNGGVCSVESGTHFYAMATGLERISDHLTNIAFSIKSPSGSQREAMDKIAHEQAQRTNERHEKQAQNIAAYQAQPHKNKHRLHDEDVSIAAVASAIADSTAPSVSVAQDGASAQSDTAPQDTTEQNDIAPQDNTEQNDTTPQDGASTQNITTPQDTTEQSGTTPQDNANDKTIAAKKAAKKSVKK